MPHLTMEYSKSLENIQPKEILKGLHCSLETCPGVDMSRVKSRLIGHDHVLNGKDAHELQMIHVTLAVLSGRKIEERKIYSQTLFNKLKEMVPESIQKTTALTVEIREMDIDSYTR